MMKQIPWIVVDTGTLLTLLLGGEGSSGYGYLPLLLDLARRKLVHLLIPDMVVAEFIGSLAPLCRDDFVGKHAAINEKNVPFGFSKANERIRFIASLLDGAVGAGIIKTPCGDEYLARIHGLMEANSDYQRDKDRQWPPTLEVLRQRLCRPHSKLYKAVKQNSLIDALGNQVSSGKQDRGELAVADSIRWVQRQHGMDTKIYALFEGSDVRAHIIQRLLSEKDSDAYHQLHGEVLSEFNPGEKKFNQNAAAGLGNINFLSTKAFLAGLMKAAHKLSPSHRIHGAEEWYILDPRESQDKKFMNHGYEELMQQVQSHGLGRAYKKYRDRPIGNMSHEQEDEYAMVNKVPQNAPWMQQIDDYMVDAAQREALRDTIHDFVKTRQHALLEDCEASFDRILHNVPKMWSETAATLLIRLTQQMGELATTMKRQFGTRAA